MQDHLHRLIGDPVGSPPEWEAGHRSEPGDIKPVAFFGAARGRDVLRPRLGIAPGRHECRWLIRDAGVAVPAPRPRPSEAGHRHRNLRHGSRQIGPWPAMPLLGSDAKHPRSGPEPQRGAMSRPGRYAALWGSFTVGATPSAHAQPGRGRNRRRHSWRRTPADTPARVLRRECRRGQSRRPAAHIRTGRPPTSERG